MGSRPGPAADVRAADDPYQTTDRSSDVGELDLDVHGVGLRVRSELPDVTDIVDATYGAFRVDRHESDRVADFTLVDLESGGPCLLLLPDGEARPMDDPEHATIALLEAMVGAVVAGLYDRGILAVHAGAAQGPTGAIVVAGRSGQGKSTLILGLVRRGLGLMSDELALLDPAAGLVRPYPRAVHVRPSTIALLPELAPLEARPRHELGGGSEWSVSPAEVAGLLGGRLGTAAPLAAVILLDGLPDAAAEPRIRPEVPAVAALDLLRSTWAASADFGSTLAAVGGMLADVPCLRLSIGRSDRTVDAVLDQLGIAHG